MHTIHTSTIVEVAEHINLFAGRFNVVLKTSPIFVDANFVHSTLRIFPLYLFDIVARENPFRAHPFSGIAIFCFAIRMDVAFGVFLDRTFTAFPCALFAARFKSAVNSDFVWCLDLVSTCSLDVRVHELLTIWHIGVEWNAGRFCCSHIFVILSVLPDLRGNNNLGFCIAVVDCEDWAFRGKVNVAP